MSSWKRSLLEKVVGSIAAAAAPSYPDVPETPRSLFVLRNNDLGDVLAVTPLFEALRRRFPQTHLAVGVGPWSQPLLSNNPHINEVISLPAPWHNKYVQGQNWCRAFGYALFDPQVVALAERRFEVGIDVLGSPLGSLLLMRAGIPCRIGVRGYAGGHSAAQKYIDFDASEHVGHAALRQAALLGATSFPENKPQVFLSSSESQNAEEMWSSHSKQNGLRIVLAPGAGLPQKRWPDVQWKELVHNLAQDHSRQFVLLGSSEERAFCDWLGNNHPSIANLAGQLDLRETLALVSRANAVVCHSSLILHAAAAWEIPTLVLLGPMFSSPDQHAQQWGHPRAVMVGAVAPPEAAAALVKLFDPTNPTDRSDQLSAFATSQP